jgi:hypothetical protein
MHTHTHTHLHTHIRTCRYYVAASNLNWPKQEYHFNTYAHTHTHTFTYTHTHMQVQRCSIELELAKTRTELQNAQNKRAMDSDTTKSWMMHVGGSPVTSTPGSGSPGNMHGGPSSPGSKSGYDWLSLSLREAQEALARQQIRCIELEGQLAVLAVRMHVGIVCIYECSPVYVYV